MKVVLHPFSAICYWLTVEVLPAASVRLDGRHAKGFTPSRGVADYLRAVCPALSFPVHVLVGSGRRTARADFCFHRFPVAWQKVVFYPVASGVYVPSPAATLVGIAPLLGFEDLCFLANTLCGCFRLDPVSPSGLASREPLSVPASVGELLANNPRIRGGRSCAGVLPFVSGGADSPPEVFMKMVFSLPAHRGGLAFGDVQANRDYHPSPRGKSIAGRNVLRPDLLIAGPKGKAAIEYDSDAVHLVSSQAVRDESKRLALEADGFKVVSLRPSQLGNRLYMEKVGAELRRNLGLRPLARMDDFLEARIRLFQMSRTYARYFDGTLGENRGASGLTL